MHRYNAQYLMNDGSTVSVLNIPHIPVLDTVEEVPDGSGRYGLVVSVERDSPKACMRQAGWPPTKEYNTR